MWDGDFTNIKIAYKEENKMYDITLKPEKKMHFINKHNICN